MPWTGILPHSFYISSTVAQHIIDVEEMFFEGTEQIKGRAFLVLSSVR